MLMYHVGLDVARASRRVSHKSEQNLETKSSTKPRLEVYIFGSDYSGMILFRQDFRLVMEKLMEKRSSEPCHRARETVFSR